MRQPSTTFCFLAIALVIFLNSCSKESGPYYVTPPGRDTSVVSYMLDVQPILNQRCISCHNETHRRLDLRPCCSYDELTSGNYFTSGVKASDSRLISELNGNISPGMPLDQPRLPQAQIDLITKWIDQGAKNN